MSFAGFDLGAGRHYPGQIAHSSKHSVLFDRACRSKRWVFPLVPACRGYADQTNTPAPHDLIFIVRTQADPLSTVSSVQQAILRAKNFATYDVAAMEHYYSVFLKRERVGAIGLLLAASGVYGGDTLRSYAAQSARLAI